jgi:RsiW-degrading membrane proteinase PrsW (M82 family)
MIDIPASGDDVPAAAGEPEPDSGYKVESNEEGAATYVPHKPAVSRKRTAAPSRDRYEHILNQRPVHSWRDFTYFLLILALIPLGFSLFGKETDSAFERLERTIDQAPPAVQERVGHVVQAMQEGKADENDLFAALPEGRFAGSHLPRKTFVHFLYGLAAALGFFVFGIFMLRSDESHPWHLPLIGLFTGTVGIVFLFIAQILATWSQGHFLISRNIFILVIFWIAWAIGFSYRAALDPSNGFISSFLGFTFGVGLCEEVCKALPLIAYYRRPGNASWHQACSWGFASGAGFGVAEAIMYSGNFYNGISTSGIYIVRFVSCVALHAIWSVSVALFIHKHQFIIQGAEGWLDFIPRVVAVVAVPMVLHGLYDTALKKELNLLALIAALVSFAWLVWCMETTRGLDEEKPAKVRARPRYA